MPEPQSTLAEEATISLYVEVTKNVYELLQAWIEQDPNRSQDEVFGQALQEFLATPSLSSIVCEASNNQER